MYVRAVASVLIWLLGSIAAGAETTARATLGVRVAVATVATIAVEPGASEIECSVPAGAAGLVPCSTTATLVADVRTGSETRAVVVSLVRISATASSGGALSGSAVQLACDGSALGPGGLCSNWAGPLVGEFRIPVTAAVDSSQVPAGIVRVRFQPQIVME